MNPEEISELIHKRPFEPFRIHQSDGATLEIRHPDHIIVDRRTCYVGIQSNQHGVFQRVAKISNLHITHIEPFDPQDRKSA